MGPDSSNFEHIWIARRVRPVIPFYVAGVFLAFSALAAFVFDSMDAVRALGAAALAAVVALVPGVLTRVEYRLTDSGLAKRAFNPKSPAEFKKLFAWDELSHVISTRTGFKFYKTMDSSNPVGRFMKLHVFAGHSGEFHVEGRDLEGVLAILQKIEIPMSKPYARSRLEAES